MSTLSASLKQSRVFAAEFDSLFPAHPFDKANILLYIAGCHKLVLDAARHFYPHRHLQFVNPVFVIDGAIYPPTELHGDPGIVKLAAANLQLIQQKVVLPISASLTANGLRGVCLALTEGSLPEYTDHLVFDLTLLHTGATPLQKQATGGQIVDVMTRLEIKADGLPPQFAELAGKLGVIFEADKEKLAKTLVLYKFFFEATGLPAFITYVNRMHTQRTFFDSLFTLVSDAPFTEAELNDFATVVDDMSQPLEDYYRKSGDRQNNDKKAAMIQRELLNSLRGVTATGATNSPQQKRGK
ncbi:MAG: hypothetical protein V4649_09455 [Bacteroidota bacterium]